MAEIIVRGGVMPGAGYFVPSEVMEAARAMLASSGKAEEMTC